MEMAVFRKSEALDVRVSDIIVCTVSQELNFMAVKAQHLNNRRLHLNKKWSQVLRDVYCKDIVKTFK